MELVDKPDYFWIQDINMKRMDLYTIVYYKDPLDFNAN